VLRWRRVGYEQWVTLKSWGHKTKYAGEHIGSQLRHLVSASTALVCDREAREGMGVTEEGGWEYNWERRKLRRVRE